VLLELGALAHGADGDTLGCRVRRSRRTGSGASRAREGLYKALSPDGNPEFSTIMKVIRALDLRLRGGPADG